MRFANLAVVVSFVAVTALALATAGALQAPTADAVPRPDDMLSPEDVRADLDEFVHAFADLHPNPFWSRPREQVENDIRTIVDRAGPHGLRRREFFRALAGVVVSLDDPHCWAFTPGWRDYAVTSQGKIFPLQLTIREGKAIVRFAPKDSGMRAGDSVVSVNGLTFTDLYREFRPITGQADDPYGDEFLSTFFARYLWFFHDMTGPFNIRFANDSGERDVVLPGLTAQEFETAQGASDAPAPLSLELLDEDPHGKIALLTFRECAEPDKIRALAEPIFQRLKDEHVTTLLVDARDNSGGTDGAWITLLEFLTSKPFSAYSGASFRVSQRLKDLVGKETFDRGYNPAAWDKPDGALIESKQTVDDLMKPDDNPLRFQGEWAVIAGRGTFSSGMSFVCAVKAHHLAPVVGEETGGRVHGFGQWVRLRLPRSGQEIAVSTKQFDGAVDVPMRRGVPPDVAVLCPPDIKPGTLDNPVLKAAIRAARHAPSDQEVPK